MISDDARQQNAELHAARPDYGTSGQKFAPDVARLLRLYGFASVLDYGCGKGTLRASLPRWAARVREYDPAIAGKDAPPEPAELLCCTDVLEHIEPDQLDAVLADIARLSRCAAYLVIDTAAAHKTLPDGRNAHLIVEPVGWWLSRLSRYFTIEQHWDVSPHEVAVLVTPADAGLPRRRLRGSALVVAEQLARALLPPAAKRVLRKAAALIPPR